MFNTSALILTALVAVIAGGLIGALLVRAFHPKQKEAKTLEARLQKAEEELKEYQQEVTEHFVATSQLVNNLTQSYKDVHEHLANSALKLTNPDVSRQLIEAGDGKLIEGSSASTPTETSDVMHSEPPKDWAPRNPGDKGQLSEEYGLDDSHKEESEIKSGTHG